MSGCPAAGLGEQELPEGAGGPVPVLQEGAAGAAGAAGLRSAPGGRTAQLRTGKLLVFPRLPSSCASWVGWEEQTERTFSVFLFLGPVTLQSLLPFALTQQHSASGARATAGLRAEQTGFGFGIGGTLGLVQLAVAASRNKRRPCASRSRTKTLPRSLARWCGGSASRGARWGECSPVPQRQQPNPEKKRQRRAVQTRLGSLRPKRDRVFGAAVPCRSLL